MPVQMVIKSNRFPEMPGAMRRAVGKGFAVARPSLLNDMRQRTPVDTGGLQGSETAESDDQSLTLHAGVNLPDARALYVHQGTRRMPARPFMREALEAGIPVVEAAIGAAIESELR